MTTPPFPVPPIDPNNPPVCDVCHQRPANVQFVEQRGAQVRALSLCSQCAQQQGINTQGGQVTLNLPSLLAQMAAATGAPGRAPVPVEAACPDCGMTVEQFREGGRLGCARCYEAFEPMIASIVKRVQAGSAHRGLAPQRLGSQAVQDLSSLREALKRAVKEERYEEAARIRDRIREAEAKPAGSGERAAGGGADQ